MNCPHCHAPNVDEARFCGACGRATAATEPAANPSLVPPPVSMIGREIGGRYRIGDKLGEGGMGAVFKAEQISLKRTVAVQMYASHGPQTPAPVIPASGQRLRSSNKALWIGEPDSDESLISGAPPECERLVKAIERLGTCDIIPVATREHMKVSGRAMRAGYATPMPAAIRAQFASSCAMTAASIEQTLTAYRCP